MGNYGKLRDAICKHMVHGPCGCECPNAPCMVDGKCKKCFPKRFLPATRKPDDAIYLSRVPPSALECLPRRKRHLQRPYHQQLMGGAALAVQNKGLRLPEATFNKRIRKSKKLWAVF